MVKIWAERIIAGTRKINEVPARYKDAVLEILREKMEVVFLGRIYTKNIGIGRFGYY